MNLLNRRLHKAGLVALLASLAVVLAACSSASSSPTTSSRRSSTDPAAGSTRGDFNGTSGEVAALAASSMEVQNESSGQTTVSWTASTKFSRSETVAATSISKNTCVTAIESSSSGSDVATSITVTSPASDGSCTTAGRAGGFPGGGGGGFPGGGSRPSFPSGSFPSGSFPSGSFPSGSGRNFDFTIARGKVISASNDSLTIDGTKSSGFNPRSTTSTTQAATTITIPLDSKTTISATVSTTSASLAVGDCVLATGNTGSTGAVTAKTVRITSTGATSSSGCSAGFGGGFARGAGGDGSNG